jgi:hypothetical protein
MANVAVTPKECKIPKDKKGLLPLSHISEGMAQACSWVGRISKRRHPWHFGNGDTDV